MVACRLHRTTSDQFCRGRSQRDWPEIGDTLTVNILGRDITARIANFRAVDFSDASINFVVTMKSCRTGRCATFVNRHGLCIRGIRGGAAARSDATVPQHHGDPCTDAIARVSEALNGIAAATSYAAGITLLTGFVVLIGAAAAGGGAGPHL